MRKSRFTKARIIGMIKQQEFEDGRMPIDNNLLDGVAVWHRHLQSDADLPRLWRRASRLATPRPHGTATAPTWHRYRRSAAVQL